VNFAWVSGPIYSYLWPAPPLSSMDSSFDGDDLSTTLGTEALAGREMVSEGFDKCAPDQRDRRSRSTVSSITRSIMRCMTNIGAASTVSSTKKLITPGEERTG
jgi:hypothetical protein